MNSIAQKAVPPWRLPISSFVIWLAAIGLFLISGLVSPAVLQVGQVLNILQVAAFLGVLATGQTLALLIGGIDLSQAGTVTLVNIVSTSLMLGSDANIASAVIICFVLALAIGFLNGFVIVVLRVTPLIATLAANSILFGAALVYTGGAPHGAAAPAFQWIGAGNLFGFPVSAIFWLVVALAVAWAMNRTVYGRWIYATGANPRAAQLMGVPVAWVTISAYVASAVLAAFGGLLFTAYIGAPSLGIGNQFLLTAVAAVVVGGTRLTGGSGSVIATMGGTLFITELNSFTNIIRATTGTQMVVQGAIIALSVLLYRSISSARG
ncbi:ABC transporter permease [Taklimakanibacter deserti]|uniref:ABC transporter permease n=1 Tax=Taklimakanibacter deserti TaxID=2267839 RepID=UPI0013C513E2